MAENQPSPWMEAAANAGQSALGGIMGLAFGSIENKRQLQQQEKLNDMAYGQHMKFTDYNTRAQMELWEKTNYAAQIEQMKKAGLNPALIYGKGGGAGGTTAAAVGGGGSQTASRGTEGIQGMGMGLQMGMMGAQIRLMEAQAKKAEADAIKTSGVDTQLAGTQIQSLTQGIENAKAQEALTKAETYLKNLQGIFEGRSMEDRLDQVYWNTNRAMTEFENAENETYINKTTRAEKIQIIRQEAIAGALRNALTRAQTDKTRSDIAVNNAQIAKWAQEIAQGWKALDQGDIKLQQGNVQMTLDKIETELKVNRPTIGQMFTESFRELLDRIARRTK